MTAMMLAALLAATPLTVTEADFAITVIRFNAGRALPALKQHHCTRGTAVRDAAGDAGR